MTNDKVTDTAAVLGPKGFPGTRDSGSKETMIEEVMFHLCCVHENNRVHTELTEGGMGASVGDQKLIIAPGPAHSLIQSWLVVSSGYMYLHVCVSVCVWSYYK